MNVWDILIIVIVLIMIVIAFHFARDRKKRGCCGDGGCTMEPGSCSKCAIKKIKK